MVNGISNSERKKEILDILETSPYVTVEYLSKKLHISESNIRKDLSALELAGAVKRSHGGVSLKDSDSMHIPFPIRMKKNEMEKKQIAIKAAGLVNDGDTVFIDPSTTCMYLAYELTKKRGITIITNSVNVLAYLQNFNMRVVCTGGVLDSEDRAAMVGNEAIKRISEMRANIAFFSPQAVDNIGNMFDCYPDEVSIVQEILKYSSKRVCLCDADKIGKLSSFKQTDMNEIDIFVCDRSQQEKFGSLFPNVKFL